MITAQNVNDNKDAVSLFFRNYAMRTGPYPAFPGVSAFLPRLWGDDDLKDPSAATYRTFLACASDRREPFAFAAGIWHPAAGAAFIESVVRRKGAVHAGQGAALIARLRDVLSSAGTEHIYLPVPREEPFWEAAGHKAASLPPDRLRAWAERSGFVALDFVFETPPADAQGRLDRRYILMHLGQPAPSFSKVAAACGQEYRRFGLNPLLASEMVFRTARYDHAPIR